MFKFTFAAVAALSVLAGSPALASGKVKADQAEAKDLPAPAASAPARYCYRVEAPTGSIVGGRVCKTLEQWRAEGVDPTKQLKN
ncbi:hypothetical protein [Sphingomonas pruni]|uniref:hypothetical protein n=1 Tax=Sphingomonas pruni TaxID=40683 RepID=UPI00082E827C|nr:hypothetical protein [Sphingomonas pruni]